MADIRINSLPSTATSFNTDDYIAIDGASAGTRKMLAATLPLTDVTLGGSSGPSVKSSLSARAPRQGLVFDGTAGATVANVPAFGTGDFTLVAFSRLDSLPAASVLFGNAAGGVVPQTFVDNLGRVVFTGSTSITTSAIITAQKAFCLTIVRASGQTTIYNNGIVVSGPTADTRNNSNSIDVIGRNSGGNYVNGFLTPLIYNRALSASEVVSLYEAGAPAGADYQTGGAGTKNTNVFVNSSFLPYTTLTGATAGLTAVIASGTAYAQSSPVFTVRIGSKVRVTGSISTAASTVYPSVSLTATDGTSLSSPTAITADGSFSIELTATVASSIATLSFFSTGNANYTVTSASVNLLGLLLAPDAAQAGGGLVWYDTSGNAANITLPASGVSWNVPTSGNVTSGTVLNLRAGGSNQDITLTPSGTGGHVNISSSGSPVLDFTRAGTLKWEAYSDGSDNFVIRDAVGAANRLTIATSTGNFLIGGSSDGGQKLQVSGTAAITDQTILGSSAISANQLLSIKKDVATYGLIGLANLSASGYSSIELFNSSSSQVGAIGYGNASVGVTGVRGKVYMYSTGDIAFLSGGTTTALTLDSSQNIVPGTAALATSATNGFIYLQTCAGAPTGVPTSFTGRVASIYDTTNNKLYIYNGGWKSVTLA